MIYDHAGQAHRIHAAMRKHGHRVTYHDSGAKVIRDASKEPHPTKSKLALHTNHNPGIAGTDEVMR